MKRFFLLAAAAILAVSALYSCKDNNKKPADDGFDVSGIIVPGTITVPSGETYKFKFVGGLGPKEGDVIRFKSEGSGKSYDCQIKNITKEYFDVQMNQDLITGQYRFIVVRGTQFRDINKIQINITYNIPVEPEDGATVYGIVQCGGQGVPDAVVSDGYVCVKTNKAGIYQLPSAKKNGYVFVSVPSGYTVNSDGVLPKFYQYLTEAASKPERADFALVREEGQENHTMLFFGDIHLANRNDDRTQFTTFTSEINNFLSEHSGQVVYAMTLGDMTWDAYWYTNNYTFTQYLVDANRMKGLKIYHTIGNHDHDMKASGDWNTVVKYKAEMCPTYYSFNVGKVHYMAVDNIECTNTSGGTTSDRHYNESVVNDEIEWIKKDLAFVDKNTPIVVTMHAATFNQTSGASLKNAAVFASCFNGFADVTFVSGHTHKIWKANPTSYKNITEYNTGAVCACWWWGGKYNRTLNIAQDGAPGGYRVMTFTGTKQESYYKGTGRPASFQFRTYDRNKILLDRTFTPSANDTNKAAFEEVVKSKFGKYGLASTENLVLINVWDYNTDWKVEVTENGNPLSVSRFTGYDPLFEASYTAQRYNVNSAPSFDPFGTNHMFKVTASSATSTLEIKVTDDEGRVYTETMKRPKMFTLDTYK